MEKKKWIAKALEYGKGKLHEALGVKEGKKIPEKKMKKAEKSTSPVMKKRVALAKTLKKMKK